MITLESLFFIKYGTQFDLNKMSFVNPSINFVGRSAKNNGVTSFVDIKDNVKPFEKGLITVALGGSILASFVQVKEFYTGQNIVTLTPKQKMTINQKLYYCMAIQNNEFRFSAFGREANRTLKTLLVPSFDELPIWIKDYDMDKFNKAHKVLNSKIKYNLELKVWKEFTYEEIFEIKKGKRLTKANMRIGDIPFIGSTDSNNGVTATVGQKPIHQGNTITVNYNGSVGEAFYQPIDFYASDDVNVLYPREELFNEFNQYIAHFIIAVIKLEQFKFNYGRKWKLERMNKSTIKLPVIDNQIDIELMENYIKTLPFSSSI